VGRLGSSRAGLNHVATKTATTPAATSDGTATRRKRTRRLCRAAARNARSSPGRLNPVQPWAPPSPSSSAKIERLILEPSSLEPSSRELSVSKPLPRSGQNAGRIPAQAPESRYPFVHLTSAGRKNRLRIWPRQGRQPPYYLPIARQPYECAKMSSAA